MVVQQQRSLHGDSDVSDDSDDSKLIIDCLHSDFDDGDYFHIMNNATPILESLPPTTMPMNTNSIKKTNEYICDKCPHKMGFLRKNAIVNVKKKKNLRGHRL